MTKKTLKQQKKQKTTAEPPKKPRRTPPLAENARAEVRHERAQCGRCRAQDPTHHVGKPSGDEAQSAVSALSGFWAGWNEGEAKGTGVCSANGWVVNPNLLGSYWYTSMIAICTHRFAGQWLFFGLWAMLWVDLKGLRWKGRHRPRRGDDFVKPQSQRLAVWQRLGPPKIIIAMETMGKPWNTMAKPLKLVLDTMETSRRLFAVLWARSEDDDVEEHSLPKEPRRGLEKRKFCLC